MTKSEFFSKPDYKRKQLILEASYYYGLGMCYDTEVYRIPEGPVKEFILMCNNERKKLSRFIILNELK